MAKRLYIGGLLYQVQPEEILDMFAEEDIQVDNIDMSIDPFSGRNPSYCFIDLDDNEDAEAVISKFQGHLIRERPIKINFDVGKREHQGRPRRIETRLNNGEWKSFDFSRTTASPFVFDRYARNDAREHWTKPIEEGRRLYVGGLSDISNQAFVNEEMRHLFDGYNIQAVSKRILPVHRNTGIAATGQCYCFVDFSSADEAEDAMAAFNGTPTPYGGVYRLNTAYNQRDRKVCREQLGFGQVAQEAKRNLDGNWRAKV